MFFIVENITTTCQMDTSEFEGMIYNMLSEEPFTHFQVACIQNQSLYNDEWIGKKRSTFYSCVSKNYDFQGVAEKFWGDIYRRKKNHIY